jgi:uncharacterized repeat protein (TIGR04076 family)
MADSWPPNGYHVIGTITSIKGTCGAGHKVGDKFEMSSRVNAGLCGWLYYNIFPHLILLQNGGHIGKGRGKSISMICPDQKNEVTIELKPKKVK